MEQKILFSLPIYQSKINPNEYDKENLILDIESNFQKNPERNVRPSMGSLHQSFHDEDNPNYKILNYSKLEQIYAKKIDEYLTQLNIISGCKFSFYIANYTCTTKSANMRPHFHSDCDFSAVHYIQFEHGVHTSTRFNNPFQWADYKEYVRPSFGTCLDNTISNSWWYDWWELETFEDDIVFFPSLLKHEIVSQKQSSKNRITIAVNISLSR